MGEQSHQCACLGSVSKQDWQQPPGSSPTLQADKARGLGLGECRASALTALSAHTIDASSSWSTCLQQSVRCKARQLKNGHVLPLCCRIGAMSVQKPSKQAFAVQPSSVGIAFSPTGAL